MPCKPRTRTAAATPSPIRSTPSPDAGGSLAAELQAPTLSRAYQCQCGRPVFLRNSQCLACQTPLGYVIERLGVVPLAPAAFEGAEADTFTVFGDAHGKAYRHCANLMTPAACNWMVPAPREGDDPSFHAEGLVPGLCLACSVTRTIPDLSVESNGQLWLSLELAKRRLISQLLALGLPVVTRLSDPGHGLAFDFLSHVPGGPHVHDRPRDGRHHAQCRGGRGRRARAHPGRDARALPHPAGPLPPRDRPLLLGPAGRARRRGSTASASCSATNARTTPRRLRNHYDNGPPPDWADRFVTSYASAHPWEDWAETWAHYLHMADTADTALSFGVDAQNVELTSDLFELADLWQPDHPGAGQFLDFLNGWVRLTNVLNELSRSMGQPDYYPFVLPRAAVGKLQFIHQVITEQRERGGLPAKGQR